jgi:hypothetical protein
MKFPREVPSQRAIRICENLGFKIVLRVTRFQLQRRGKGEGLVMHSGTNPLPLFCFPLFSLVKDEVFALLEKLLGF